MPNADNSQDSTSQNGSEGGGSKLSLGQRVLLLLPDLNKSKTSSSSKTTPKKRPVATRTPVSEEEEIVEPPTPRPAKRNRYAPPAGTESADNLPKPVKASSKVDSDLDTQDVVKEDSTVEEDSYEEEVASEEERPSSNKPPSRKAGTPYTAMKTSELKYLLKNLEDRERRYVFLGTILGIILTIVVVAVGLHHNSTVHGSKHENPSLIVTIGLVGIVLALLASVAAYFRKRSLTAFALLFYSISLGSIEIMLPFWILAGYLIYRPWKIQKELAARGVDIRPTSGSARTNSARNTPARNSPRAKQSSKPSGPTPSKRYTPPKPAPKRPVALKPEDQEKAEKPNWFDRRAERSPKS